MWFLSSDVSRATGNLEARVYCFIILQELIEWFRLFGCDKVTTVPGDWIWPLILKTES